MSFWDKHSGIGPLIISERLWLKVLAAEPDVVTDAKTVSVCERCGSLFYGFRADATTCSNACRQRRHQRRNGEGSPERRRRQQIAQEMWKLNRRDPNWRSRIPGCDELSKSQGKTESGKGGWRVGWAERAIATGDISNAALPGRRPRPSDVRWQDCRIQVGESADLDALEEAAEWLHPETRKLSGSEQRARRGSRNRWETSPEPWVLPEDDASLLAEIAAATETERAKPKRRPLNGDVLATRATAFGRKRQIRYAPAAASEATSDHSPVPDHRGTAPRLLRTPRPRGGAARVGSTH